MRREIATALYIIKTINDFSEGRHIKVLKEQVTVLKKIDYNIQFRKNYDK